MDFRKRMFQFCNLLEDTELNQKISQTMDSISVSKKYNNTIEPTIPMALGSQRTQFFGYLLIDDSIDDIRKHDPLFKELKHLTSEE